MPGRANQKEGRIMRDPLTLQVQKQGTFEVPSAETHLATLVGVIDLGTQTRKGFQGAPATEKREVALVWELEERDSKGTPHRMAQSYTLTADERSKLRQLLQKYHRRTFAEGDSLGLRDLIGTTWVLDVSHTETVKDGKKKTFANLVSAGPPRKGDKGPKPHDGTITYSLADGPFIDPGWLPRVYGSTIADIISMAKENAGKHAPGPSARAEAARTGSGIPGRSSPPGAADDDAAPF